MSSRAIREAVQNLAGNQLNAKVHIGKAEVQSYDIPSRTCTVILIDGHADNERIVSLIPEVDDSILILPTEGATVWIAWNDFIPAFLVGFPSAYDKLYLGTGGENGGLPMVTPLTKKLNNIENKVNDLINAFNSHVHPGVQSGAGSTSSTPTQINGTLTPTVVDDIQSTTIFQ